MTSRPVRTARLTPDQQAAVLRLVEAAEGADGVRPVSEQAGLAVRGRSGRPVEHVLVYAGEDAAAPAPDAELAGYLQLDDEDSAELVVAPAHRRSGVASALLELVPHGTRIWAHGDRPAADAFAAARGLAVVRELYLLGRRFDEAGPVDDPVLPEGLVARAFEPGRDEEEWLRVNAAAFAHHAEQGRMTRADLDARMDEPWFDPAGLLLVVPADDPGTVVAFHWTKVATRDTGQAHAPGEARAASPGGSGRAHAPGEARAASPGGSGEVYVVGVDPAYQGRGLGRPVTLLGLAHLQGRGVEDVVLYVDGDNPAALTVYRGLGFTTRSVDRMFARR